MSRFLQERYRDLEPYVPGEQPQGLDKLVKLNTNENPYPLSEKAAAVAAEKLRGFQLYPDPDYAELRNAFAAWLGVSPAQVMPTNGSDEALDLAFKAYCGERTPAVFPDITYGFYPVFAAANGLPSQIVPLRDDFTMDLDALCDAQGTLFIANPNAPTGALLSVDEIESLVAADSDRIVVVDEAYIDFGGESCVGLIDRYENVLITQTFSKSRSMAGLRLGFAIGSEALIADLNTLRCSMNPYNVNEAAVAYGLGALADEDAFDAARQKICATREETIGRLRALGFQVIDSYANFIFARTSQMAGEELYRRLKERGIIVRHFGVERIEDFNRITIGTPEQMDALVAALEDILG